MLEFLAVVGAVYAICRLVECCSGCQGSTPSYAQQYEPQRPQPPVHRYEVHPQIHPPLSYGSISVTPSSSQRYEPQHPRPPVSRCETHPQIRPPPSHGNTSITHQPPAPRHDEYEYERDTDISRTDETSTVEAYESLRARAKKEGDLMAQCYKRSKDAYKRHNGANAKALSEQGKRHARQRDVLDAKASAMVFKKNNQDTTSGKVDLHGLYVKEAITYSEKAVVEAIRKGKSEVRFIVGQGIHSSGGVARIKPAIQKHMQKRGFRVQSDSKNPGVLIVQLGSNE